MREPVVDKAITAKNKRSIIEVRSDNMMCLTRSVVVVAAEQYKKTMQSIFKGNSNDAELKGIDRTKTQINECKLSDYEKLYLIDSQRSKQF
jgi:hypothetical protein